MNLQRESLPFDVHKIAVVRANGIGDFVFVLPALASLRRTFPDAEIVLLGQQWHADFLKERPGPVDRVIPLPVYPGVGAPVDATPCSAEVEDFFEAMRSERFDLALQLHGGGRYSNPLTCRLGARLTAGLRAEDAMPLDRWLPYVYFQSEVLRYLEAVSLVGASSVSLQPRLAVTEKDLAESRVAIPCDPPLPDPRCSGREERQLAHQPERPIAILSPGASDPKRRWAPAKFAAVGDTLVKKGMRVVVTGNAAERHLVESVTENMREPAEAAWGLSLSGLVGLLSRAQLLVGNDSGPLHLAGAVNVNTVGLFWCVNLITAGPPWRAGHRPVISWRLNCPLCDRNTIHDRCSHSASFVDDIPVADVTGYSLELLEGRLLPEFADTPGPL